MSKYELSKQEAINLITPVVDNEASDREKDAFFDFIEQDEEVRKQYKSALAVKNLISKRCRRTKAPDSLHERIRTLIPPEGTDNSRHLSEEPIYDKPFSGSFKQNDISLQNPGTGTGTLFSRFLYSVAAGIVLILMLGGIYYYNSSFGTELASYNIEEHAFEHFQKYEGNFVPPNIATASISYAENQLARNYDMPITVPSLNSTEFKGVVYSEFVPGYEAPMLEYYLSTEDQYIYIFAFRIDQLEKFGKLVRNEEAIKKCSRPQNFHIRNVSGKHVVSWKWDNIWYAAISNHPGDTIASLVKHLEQ